MEIAEEHVALSEFIQRTIVAVFFLVATLLILRECRLGIAEFSNLIRAAWGAEWKGKERVGSFNRGASVIWFVLAFAVFLTREIHAFLRSQNTDLTVVAWMFFSGLVFLTLSLVLLAHIEKSKNDRSAARKQPVTQE